MPALALHGPPGLLQSGAKAKTGIGAFDVAVGVPDVGAPLGNGIPTTTVGGVGLATETTPVGPAQASGEGVVRVNVAPTGLRDTTVAVDPRVGLRGRLQWGPLAVALEASGMIDFALFGTGLALGGTAGATGLVELRLGPVRVYGGAEAGAHWLYFGANLIMGYASEQTRRLASTFGGVAVDLGPVTLFGTAGPTWTDDTARHEREGQWGDWSTVTQPFVWMAGGGVRINSAWFDRREVRSHW